MQQQSPSPSNAPGPPPVPERVTFDEQLWPVNVALLLLAGFSAGVIVAKGDFLTPDFWYNARTHLVLLSAVMVGLIGAVVTVRKRTARRLQLALLVSMIAHLGVLLALIDQSSELPPKASPIAAVLPKTPRIEREITFLREPLRNATQPATPQVEEPPPEVATVLQPNLAAPVDRPAQPVTTSTPRVLPAAPPPGGAESTAVARNDLPRPEAEESAPQRAENTGLLSRSITAQPRDPERIVAPAGPKVQETTPFEAKQPTAELTRQAGETRLPKRPLGDVTVGPTPSVSAAATRREGETTPQLASAPALTKPLARPGELPRTEITAPQELAKGDPPSAAELRPTMAAAGRRTVGPNVGATPTPANVAAPLTTSVGRAPLLPSQPLEPSTSIAQVPQAGLSRSAVTRTTSGNPLTETVASTATSPSTTGPATSDSAAGSGPSLTSAATRGIARATNTGPGGPGAGSPGRGAPELPAGAGRISTTLSNQPRPDLSTPGLGSGPPAPRPNALAARTAVSSTVVGSPRSIDAPGIGADPGPTAVATLAPSTGAGVMRTAPGTGSGSGSRGSPGPLTVTGVDGPGNGVGTTAGGGSGIARRAPGAVGESQGTPLGTGGGGRLSRAPTGRTGLAAGTGGAIGVELGPHGSIAVNDGGAGPGSGAGGMAGAVSIERAGAGPPRGSRTGTPGTGGGAGEPGLGGGGIAAGAPVALASAGGGDDPHSGTGGVAGGTGTGGPGGGIGGGGLSRARTGGTALASIAATGEAGVPQSPAPGGGSGHEGLPVGLQAVGSIQRGTAGTGGGGTATAGLGSGTVGAPGLASGTAGGGIPGEATLGGGAGGSGLGGGGPPGKAEFADAMPGNAPGGGNLRPRTANSGGAGLVAGNKADLPEVAPVGGGGTAESGGAYEVAVAGPQRGVGGIAGPANTGPLGALGADRLIEGTPGATAVNPSARPAAQDGEVGPPSIAGTGAGLTLKKATGASGPLGGGAEELIAQPSLGGGSGDGEPAGPQPGELLPTRPAGGANVVIASADGPGGLGPEFSPQVGAIARNARREGEVASSGGRRFLQRTTGGLLAVSGRVREGSEGFGGRGRGRGFGDPDGTGKPSLRSEQAVERGLDFLARQQAKDGSWSLWSYAGAEEMTDNAVESHTAATGLALLALLGAGYDHYGDKHQATVRKGLEYLLDNQEDSGDLYVPEDVRSNQSAQLYSHAMAAIALCEAYGMTGDEKLRGPAQKALDFIADSQEPKKFGWRYSPGFGADTSVTGWMLMALKSGELAGLKVDPETFRRVGKFLDHASPDGGVQYAYNMYAADNEKQKLGRLPSVSMTSVGLLMRLYLDPSGWNNKRSEMVRGAEILKSNLPELGGDPKKHDTYYWYYATQVMFHMKGDYWKKWNERLHPLLINSQVTAGRLAGSWHPRGDRWGPHGGRIYVTTMNLLSLEVYYRHLPIYDAKKLQEINAKSGDETAKK